MATGSSNMDSGQADPLTDAADDGTTVSSTRKFHVDRDLIPLAHLSDEVADLQGLGLDVFNQEDFEQGVLQQVDQAFIKEQEDRKKASLKKDLKNVTDEIRSMKHELASLATQLAQLVRGGAAAQRRLMSARKQKETKLNQMKVLEEKKKKIQAKLDGKAPLFDDKEKDLAKVLETSGNQWKDQLIKTGQMTPFGTIVKQESTDTEPAVQQQDITSAPTAAVKEGPVDDARPSTSAAAADGTHDDTEFHSDGEEWKPSDQEHVSDSDLDDIDLQPEDLDDVEQKKPGRKSSKKSRKLWSNIHKRPIYRSGSEGEEEDSVKEPRAKAIRKYKDDGNEDNYDTRMETFHYLERKKQKQREAGQLSDSDDDEEFDGGLKIPGRIWSKLYKYQKTCVKWLWELHCQQAGGIVGDEMGLGKTIQAIAFLAGLKYSKLRSRNLSYVGLGPSILICPATVMHQWVKEFHTWWPPFRVAILHSSGTYTGKEKELIHHVVKTSGVLVTSYSTLVLQQEHILRYNWHYIVLDEGHKIRNPDVQATLVCKQFRTPHRIILSGSPIQNNLRELWSLMDFVFPGKLGTLPDFTQHLAVPIVQGGYANASDVQVQTAYKCACVLRDTINPYLLRRMKADVKMAINLPAKNEQVLFCRLSQEQREVYQEYLDSRECYEILSGRFMVFPGLITLRKICNHPDLSTGGPRVFKGDNTGGDPALEYGYYKRAGKMIVVEALLKLWKKQGHRALIFTQSKQMLDLLEDFVQMKHYTYVRMDGSTGISSRQPLVQKYNTDDNIYLFLLTTRVGGLGINLVGANRVIIYDPDWNPSTDMQARERAWRIGQKRQVTVYRLLTTGTIEEKIYHRQIYKQFLTNRVLKDPKQRRLFKTNDLYELFSLGLSDDKRETETAAMFAGTGSDVSVKFNKKSENRFDRMKKEKAEKAKEKESKAKEQSDEDQDASLNFNEEEIKKMREMARMLSQKIGQGKVSTGETSGNKRSDSGSDSKGEKSESKLKGDNESPVTVAECEKAKSDKLKQYVIKKKSSSGKEFVQLDKADSAKSSSSSTALCTSGEVRTTSRDTKEVLDKDKCSGSREEMSRKRKREELGDERREKHKKKKHKKKDAKFDGERIPHLDKMRTYKGTQSEAKTPMEEEHMNDYVLQKLFKKTGIQGALKHDKIMEPGQADYVIVESEAEKVAKEASQALKKSRSMCLPATAGVPSWTGQHGVRRPRFGQKKNTILSRSEKPSTPQSSKAGENYSKEKHFDGSLAGSVQTNIETGASVSGAISSTDLLSKMRVRNEVFTKPAQSEGNDNNVDDDGDSFVSDPKAFDLLKRMREFILFECRNIGEASTQELLDEFGEKLPPQNSAQFRALLQSICDLEKRDGIGIWKLRGDYR